ncbi:hypothetical protein [Amycolatopsis sp. NPDC051716]|uniref:hypothetical protein n=1 Tax=Actinomycetes TaxID=1760 RepID=UPI00344221A8
MRTGRQFDTGHVGYLTTSGTASATWRREGGNRAVVMFIDDTSSDRPARRWPDERMDFRPGHIAFDPEAYPSIAKARELLPEYGALWDAVEDEYRTTLAAPRTPDSAYAQHAAFFDVSA